MTRPVAGRCPTCGHRTLRDLIDGQPVEVTVAEHTAADELRAWATGQRTFALTWRDGMHLAPRTTHDLLTAPAGYTPAQIHAEHTCTTHTREIA